MRWLFLPLPLLAALSGCALVDQTWFNSPPPKPVSTSAPPAEKLEGRTPLIVIAFAAAGSDYVEKLSFAVRAAEAAKPNIAYDVIGIALATGTPAVQALAEQAAAANATKIMRAILANGVPSGRIRLGVRTEAGLATPEVRVFVR